MAMDGKSIKSTLTGGNSSYQNFVTMVSVYSHHQGASHFLTKQKHLA